MTKINFQVGNYYKLNNGDILKITEVDPKKESAYAYGKLLRLKKNKHERHYMTIHSVDRNGIYYTDKTPSKFDVNPHAKVMQSEIDLMKKVSSGKYARELDAKVKGKYIIETDNRYDHGRFIFGGTYLECKIQMNTLCGLGDLTIRKID
jgi:hypothetical protein